MTRPLLSRLALSALLFLLCQPIFAESKIVEFTPQGYVKQIRQVRVRFSSPMVPFGDPRALVNPFQMTCSLKGEGRWVDPTNWVYDFSEDLKAGVGCQFTLADSLKTLAGESISGPRVFAFNTGGPSVVQTNPMEGDYSAISEDQIFILTIDAIPNVKSVEQHAHFEVDQIAEQIGIRTITGDERARLLKTLWRTDSPDRLVMLQALRPFPSNTVVRLVWGKGIETSDGVPGTQDQVLHYKTRPPFTVNFSCQRANAQDGCLPFTPMTIGFSAPIAWQQVKQIALTSKDGKRWSAKRQKEEEDNSCATIESVTLYPPFPAHQDFSLQIPAGLRDDAGRPLANAGQFPLAIKTDDYPPLAKFSAPFGILELKSNPALPVTLRNVEPMMKTRVSKIEDSSTGLSGLVGKFTGRLLRTAPSAKASDIVRWLAKVQQASMYRDRSIFPQMRTTATKEFSVPKPNGAKAFEVIGIPLEEPGLYVVEMESEILGKALLENQKPMFVPTVALVTDMSVHLKWGRESSLVWVTTLSKGTPVANAKVSVQTCNDRVLWEGETDSSGIARLGVLPPAQELPNCTEDGIYSRSRLVVIARSGNDYSFVLDQWEDGIEPWRFGLPQDYAATPEPSAHTVFDRTLFRAGETVHMKHILRHKRMEGFILPTDSERPTMVEIEHTGSEQTYQLPLQWDSNAVAVTEWTIPVEAKLGYYAVSLLKGNSANREERRWGQGTIASGSFRVEEFRIPLMKAVVRSPARELVGSAPVTMDFAVSYLAGGGAGGLPVKFRSQVRPSALPRFEGYEDFVMGNGPMVKRDRNQDYMPTPTAETWNAQELQLDKSGTGRATIQSIPTITQGMEIQSELEFRDPNGEVQTVSSNIPIWPARRIVGLKPDSWGMSANSFKIKSVVLDLAGRPVPQTLVNLKMYQRKYISHRKRLVGGFYSYEHAEKITPLGPLCSGLTNAQGLLICEAKSSVDGNVIIQAEVMDAEGNKSVTHQDIWLAGREDFWFSVGDSDRIDVIPLKKRYEPGETAQFQVRMPFKEATALVTVEREGVMKSYVRPLSRKHPQIDIPVEGHFAPNVFVSVLVVRGRVGDVQPTALVDLGRPAYKLGITEIKVGWKAHELGVQVKADRSVYRVREKALVKIHVKRADGRSLEKDSEVAVAAVDEGLLELMPNASWDLLKAMMGQRGNTVHTATAQMQVIGRRHFGLKALPQGGSGGRQTTRELFDTLLYWNPRVKLDARGDAEVEVPLNDSLTRFRLVAVANAGAGSFGSGETSIRSTQDLMILPGLSPIVRAGDRYRAYFTIRNATDRPMKTTVKCQIQGVSQYFQPMELRLASGQSQDISWMFTVPLTTSSLSYEIQATADSGATDSLKRTQRILESVAVRVYQATLQQLGDTLQIPTQRPSDAIPGRGEVRVSYRPSLTGDVVNTIADYMQHYTYNCLEQEMSKAITLDDHARRKSIERMLPVYLDSDGLAKYFPTCLRGDPTLTAYVLAIANEAGWTLPTASVTKMTQGLDAFIAGRIRWEPILPTADLSIRKLEAIEALSRYGQGSAAQLASITLEPNLMPTSAVLNWYSILHRIEVPDRSQRKAEAEQILKSRLNVQGTTMGFSTEGSDALWWLMVSCDVNAVRLILNGLSEDAWKTDMPKLMRGAIGRQLHGHWDLTVANAWGRLALDKFKKQYESETVSGSSRSSLLKEVRTMDWSSLPEGGSVSHAWPSTPETLTVSHAGSGKPWVTIASMAAIPLKKPISSGYHITKTWTPIEQRKPGSWSRGDIARIHLDLESQADMTWVVVQDPIPAGASLLGSGLGRDSAMATQGQRYQGWVWPVFEERAFDAYRAYYEFVPKGKWSLEYTVRFNTDGTYQIPSTRVEAMYSPEMYGENPGQSLTILP